MKGQSPLIVLIVIGVILVIIGGLMLAYTIMSPSTLGIGLIIVGIMFIGIASKFS